MNSSRILIVEDERIVAKDIQTKLRSFGYLTTSLASSAEEAISAATEFRPDLILMDIVLRGKASGIEAAQEIHKHSDIPIIYLTAYGDAQTLDRAKHTGPVGYILKPFKERELQIAVEMALYKYQMERRLKEHEEWLNTTLESIGDGVIATDITGVIQFMNAPAESLTGWSKEDALGKDLVDVYHVIDSDTRERLMDPVATVLLEGRDFELSNHTIVRGVTGVETPIQQSGSQIKDNDGNIFGIVLVIRDMSEQHRYLEALRRSQERYRLLFEHNPQPMWVVDKETMSFFAVNTAAVAAYGYSEEEFGNMTIHDIHHHDAGGVSQREAPTQGIWKHRRKDGTMLVAEISAHELQFEGRDALIMQATDVTERERAYEAVRESEERHRNLIENARDAIFTLSRDATFTTLNPAFERITGQNRNEWIGKSFTTLVHPDDLKVATERFGKTLKGIQSPVFELRLRTTSDEPVTVEITTAPQHHGDAVTGVLGIARDITERKRLEEHVRENQKLDGLGTLAGGVAHDFNNILGIVLGHATLVNDMSGDSNPPIAKSMKAITTAVERGSGVVKQLMAFARKTDVQRGPVDLNQEINVTLALLKETFPRSINFKHTLTKGIPLIYADRNQIHQVLLNLTVNARDAMPGGGTITFSTDVVQTSALRGRFTDMTDEQYVHVSVSDSGSGIDESIINRIFEPFFTTKGPGGGTGLGLSVVYGVVKNHHGFIDVDSEVGRGTTFHLYLPLWVDTRTSAEAPNVHGGENLRGKETILVIEDEKPLLELLCASFESAGYTVIRAGSGPEGVERFEQNKGAISAVVADIGLPGYSGWEVYEKIQKISPTVKMLLASGYLDPQRLSQTGSSANLEIVEKPYQPIQILSRVRRMLNQK